MAWDQWVIGPRVCQRTRDKHRELRIDCAAAREASHIMLGICWQRCCEIETWTGVCTGMDRITEIVISSLSYH